MLAGRFSVQIAYVCGEPKTREARAAYRKVDPACIVSVNDLSEALRHADAIIDAVYGFSFHGPLDPEMKKIHRFGMAMYITDEIFAIEIARPGYLHPFYTYGAAAIASPMWAAGTALGILAGNLMPVRIVSALSVALFGMFLAVIIPPARKDRVILVLILVCFAASWISEKLPLVGTLSQGNRVILLTVILSAAAALLFPHPAEEDKDN